jgi:endonuclease G, mitochondrial
LFTETVQSIFYTTMGWYRFKAIVAYNSFHGIVNSVHRKNNINKQDGVRHLRRYASSTNRLLSVMATSTNPSSSLLEQRGRSGPTEPDMKPSRSKTLHEPIGPWRFIQDNPYVVMCFDTRTRNSIYVQHKLDCEKKDISGSAFSETNALNQSTVQPRNRFHEDTSVEPMFRPCNSHYHNSGYTRGHLAPAGDFRRPPQTHRKTKQCENLIRDTYNLCNVSPQCPELNCIVMNQLEQFVRRTAEQYYEEQDSVTYVTTGPVYLPSVQPHPSNDKFFSCTSFGIGKPSAIIMVPTHFFKVVVVLDKTETKVVNYACYLLQNDPSVLTNQSALHKFIVPWTDLETVTGLTLYADLIDKVWENGADRNKVNRTLHDAA